MPDIDGQDAPPASAEASAVFRNEMDRDRDERARALRKRMSNAFSGFRHPETPFMVKTLTIFIGPFNYITAWLLKMHHLRFRNPLLLEQSILLDLKHAPASPVLVVRQHFSAMLCRPVQETCLSGLFCDDQHGAVTAARISKLHRVLLVCDGDLMSRFDFELNDKCPQMWYGLCDV